MFAVRLSVWQDEGICASVSVSETVARVWH